MAKPFSLEESTPTTPSESDIPSEVAEAASEIMNAAPEVSEHAIEAMEAEENNAPKESVPASAGPVPASPAGAPKAGDKDKFGTPFDPAKHTGSMLKSGAWRERKKSVLVDPRSKSQSQVSAAQNEAMARATGKMMAESFFQIGGILGGSEWQPDNMDERQMMYQAFGDYCVAKGHNDFPPGMALCIAVGSYSMARFHRPKTAARIGGIKGWIAARFLKWRVNKELKRRGVQMRAEIRDGVVMIGDKKAVDALTSLDAKAASVK